MTPDAERFLERFYAELPIRIHNRDTNESGNPDMHPKFLNYVSDGEQGWATTRSDDLVSCAHPGVDPRRPRSCDACNDTGYRQRIGRRYVRPVKRTLKLLSQTWVPKDRPRLDVLLVSFAFNSGSYAQTAQALRPSYAYMWSVPRAERFVAFALRAFWAAYREEDAYHHNLSEAQLDAESERRAA